MNLAVSLWHLVQQDRLARWAAYASIVVLWFALAWADGRILLMLPLIVLCSWWLRRQRERHGWLQEPEEDLDLL